MPRKWWSGLSWLLFRLSLVCLDLREAYRLKAALFIATQFKQQNGKAFDEITDALIAGKKVEMKVSNTLTHKEETASVN